RPRARTSVAIPRRDVQSVQPRPVRHSEPDVGGYRRGGVPDQSEFRTHFGPAQQSSEYANDVALSVLMTGCGCLYSTPLSFMLPFLGLLSAGEGDCRTVVKPGGPARVGEE